MARFRAPRCGTLREDDAKLRIDVREVAEPSLREAPRLADDARSEEELLAALELAAQEQTKAV